MKRTSDISLLTAERPYMSDEERAERLAELAERIVDPTWLDRETLANIEQLTDDNA